MALLFLVFFLRIVLQKFNVILAEARTQDSLLMKQYAVYMLASGKNGTLSIGVTGGECCLESGLVLNSIL